MRGRKLSKRGHSNVHYVARLPFGIPTVQGYPQLDERELQALRHARPNVVRQLQVNQSTGGYLHDAPRSIPASPRGPSAPILVMAVFKVSNAAVVSPTEHARHIAAYNAS